MQCLTAPVRSPEKSCGLELIAWFIAILVAFSLLNIHLDDQLVTNTKIFESKVD